MDVFAGGSNVSGKAEEILAGIQSDLPLIESQNIQCFCQYKHRKVAFDRVK